MFLFVCELKLDFYKFDTHIVQQAFWTVKSPVLLMLVF